MGMEKLMVKQDGIKFIAVFNVCGHVEFMKKGRLSFELTRWIHTLELEFPQKECRVDIFGLVGLMGAARNFVMEVWMTLFSVYENY